MTEGGEGKHYSVQRGISCTGTKEMCGSWSFFFFRLVSICQIGKDWESKVRLFKLFFDTKLTVHPKPQSKEPIPGGVRTVRTDSRAGQDESHKRVVSVRPSLMKHLILEFRKPVLGQASLLSKGQQIQVLVDRIGTPLSRASPQGCARKG